MNKKNIVIAALVVVLVVTFSFIGVSAYKKSLYEDKLDAYNQGATRGYQTAIVDVAKLAVTCETVPLKIQNQTIEMVAVECLRQAQEQAGGK